MSRIEFYFLLAVGCMLDLSDADFYNSSGFSAYTWPGLVISKAVSLTCAIMTQSRCMIYFLPFLRLCDRLSGSFQSLNDIINMLNIITCQKISTIMLLC